jgi:ribose/xylose/arabinose/galactoside ABC-type transport system permease subunit
VGRAELARSVIGLARPFGGKGSVAGALLGTLIIDGLANILNLTGFDPSFRSSSRERSSCRRSLS